MRTYASITARQRTKIDHVARFLGGPVVVWHELKKKHKDKLFMVEKLEKLCNKQYTRFEAYMLMANSNQKIFGDVLKSLQFTHQCNDSKYLKTVTQVKNLLTRQLTTDNPTGRYSNQFQSSNNNN